MADAPEVSILFLGDDDVGKSTFLTRISKGSAPTLKDIKVIPLRDQDQPFIYDVRLFGREYRFKIFDTTGPTPWSEVKPDVIVLCFDISQRLSLINMQHLWMPSISRNLTSAHDIPTLILGLKRDLRSETDPNGIIYPQEAYRIAQEMRSDKYMECSALTGELMKEAWEDICRTSAKCVVGRAGMVGGDGEDTDRGERSQGGLSEGACVVM